MMVPAIVAMMLARGYIKVTRDGRRTTLLGGGATPPTPPSSPTTTPSPSSPDLMGGNMPRPAMIRTTRQTRQDTRDLFLPLSLKHVSAPPRRFARKAPSQAMGRRLDWREDDTRLRTTEQPATSSLTMRTISSRRNADHEQKSSLRETYYTSRISEPRPTLRQPGGRLSSESARAAASSGGLTLQGGARRPADEAAHASGIDAPRVVRDARAAHPLLHSIPSGHQTQWACRTGCRNVRVVKEAHPTHPSGPARVAAASVAAPGVVRSQEASHKKHSEGRSETPEARPSAPHHVRWGLSSSHATGATRRATARTAAPLAAHVDSGAQKVVQLAPSKVATSSTRASGRENVRSGAKAFRSLSARPLQRMNV